MLHGVKKSFVTVSVDGELVGQEVYVDVSTGLDIDAHTGTFRTRAETEMLIRDVYRVGRDALPKELERYNKWMQEGSQSHGSRFVPQRISSVAKAGSSAGTQSGSEEAEEWKVRGNNAMLRGDARRAAYCYSEALRSKPSSAVLFTNRAAAMINLGRAYDALSDAERAIELDSTNVKAWFRKATALCLLGSRTAASKCIKESVARFGMDTAWQSLENRVLATARALLVNHKWICLEDVTEGEELCALEGLELPCANAREVLRIWAENGIPQEVLAKEAAYYALRGIELEFDPYSGVLAAQRFYGNLLDVDFEITTGSNLANIFRWCCILLGPVEPGMTAETSPFLEKIFGDGYVFLGASLFLCSDRSDANVTLFFDQGSHSLRVIAHRSIKQYETLLSLSLPES